MIRIDADEKEIFFAFAIIREEPRDPRSWF
jgi:hypothetical protein